MSWVLQPSTWKIGTRRWLLLEINSGDKKWWNITFLPCCRGSDDVETLQDMVTVQALNDALGQIDEAIHKNHWVHFSGKYAILKSKRESRGLFLYTSIQTT